jgi:hypothetical protein
VLSHLEYSAKPSKDVFQQSVAAEEGLSRKYQGENKVQSANLRKMLGLCIFSLGSQNRVRKLFKIHCRSLTMTFAEQLVQQSGRRVLHRRSFYPGHVSSARSTLELMKKQYGRFSEYGVLGD